MILKLIKGIELKIRYDTPSVFEVDQIIEVWKVSGLTYRPVGRDTREKIVEQLKQDSELFVAAYDNDKMIGVIFGTFDGRKGCVNRLAVIPDYRRMGIGHHLLEICEENLKEAGATVIFSLIERENHPSRKMLEKDGYDFGDNILYYSKRDHPDA